MAKLERKSLIRNLLDHPYVFPHERIDSMLKVIIAFACALMAFPVHSASLVQKPMKLTGTVIGGLAAGGYALYCANQPSCLPGVKSAIRKGKEIVDQHRQTDGFDYIPAPKDLPGLPGAIRAKPKSANQGGKLRPRWNLPNGDIAEWDSQHGEVEIYDKRGRHKGVRDPNTGKEIKPAVPGRKTNT